MTRTQSIPLFAETQLRLLQQEHETEISSSALANTTASASPSTRRTLQATGHALTGIVLSQCRTGLGGRVVGEFTADPAISTSAKSDTNGTGRDKDADGRPRLGPHGIRVGDNVRVNDVSSGSGKKNVGGKNKDKGSDTRRSDNDSKGPEGVVTKVGERSILVAFGQRGAGGHTKDDDEAIDELWGKKLWLYAYLLFRSCLTRYFYFKTMSLNSAAICFLVDPC